MLPGARNGESTMNGTNMAGDVGTVNPRIAVRRLLRDARRFANAGRRDAARALRAEARAIMGRRR